jgi:hypothetical protein
LASEPISIARRNRVLPQSSPSHRSPLRADLRSAPPRLALVRLALLRSARLKMPKTGDVRCRLSSGTLRRRGDGHPKSRAVLTPRGRFGSMALAAKAFEVDPTTIHKRVRRGLRGWRWG